MAVDVSKVIVGQAVLYTAPVGTAYPADTMAEGAPWATPWVHAGATEEGVSLAVGTDTTDIRIEEQAAPVDVLKNVLNVRVLLALSEDTIENMKLAYGGGVLATTAAATGQPGKKTLTLSDSFDKLAVGLEGLNPSGFFRRVRIPKIISVADVTTAYRRSANNRSYAIELRAICATNEIQTVDKASAAL